MANNKFYNNIYQKAPLWFQNILISAYGYKLINERYQNHYYEYLNYLKKKDFSQHEYEKEIQNTEFLKLFHFAINNSPFYKKFYKDVNIKEIKSINDIVKLPILDKETLRENITDVYTIPPSKGIVSFTGGTTGKSLQVVFTKEDNQKRMAYLDYFKWKHGFENGKMKAARFNGKNIIPLDQKEKIFWRKNYFNKQRIYSSFFITQENIPFYIENLNKYKPEEIDGFVTSIYEIAKFMKEKGIYADFTPKAVFPTSETVLPIHKETISEIFNCPVRDQYASSEGAPFITECTAGNMHENIDTGVFEHIKTEFGTKLIVTGFHTYGTPLIRYDIGDNILESEEKVICTCGCSHPIIKAIDGRKADYLFSEERGKINLGNLSNVIKELPNCIKNIQFIQNSLEQIDVYVVIDKKSFKPEYEKLIHQEMINRFGDKMKFPIYKVDKISREKSGKYSMIKNNIK